MPRRRYRLRKREYDPSKEKAQRKPGKIFSKAYLDDLHDIYQLASKHGANWEEYFAEPKFQRLAEKYGASIWNTVARSVQSYQNKNKRPTDNSGQPQSKKLKLPTNTEQGQQMSTNRQHAPAKAIATDDKHYRRHYKKGQDKREHRFIRQYKKALYWMKELHNKSITRASVIGSETVDQAAWASVNLSHCNWYSSASEACGGKDLYKTLYQNATGTAKITGNEATDSSKDDDPVMMRIKSASAKIFLRNTDDVSFRVTVFHYYCKKLLQNDQYTKSTVTGPASFMAYSIQGLDTADVPEEHPTQLDKGSAVGNITDYHFHPLQSEGFTQYFTLTKEDNYVMNSGDFVEFTVHGRPGSINLRDNQATSCTRLASGVLIRVVGFPNVIAAAGSDTHRLAEAATHGKGLVVHSKTNYQYKVYRPSDFEPNQNLASINAGLNTDGNHKDLT